MIDLDNLKRQFDLREIMLPGQGRSHIHQASGEKRRLVVCPFHEDHDPSLEIGPLYYSCYGCGAWGSIIDWLCFSETLSFPEAIVRAVEMSGQDMMSLASGYKAAPKGLPENYKPIQLSPMSNTFSKRVSIWRDNLFEADALADLCEGWAIDPATAWFFELGYEGDHFVIPVRNAKKELVTLQYKRHINQSQPKYWGVRGRNPQLLYNASSLYELITSDTIFNEKAPVSGHPETGIVCFGELSAMCCQEAFARLDIPVASVTPTCGAKSWVRDWRRKFMKCKEVYIVPDVGEEVAAVDVASCFPDRAKIVFLDGKEGFDVNDFMKNQTPKELQSLFENNSSRYGQMFQFYSRGGGEKWSAI